MSVWSATRAKRVYAALLRQGWALKKQVGSHRKPHRSGSPNFTFASTTAKKWDPQHLPRSGKRRVSVQKIFEIDITVRSKEVSNDVTSVHPQGGYHLRLR